MCFLRVGAEDAARLLNIIMWFYCVKEAPYQGCGSMIDGRGLVRVPDSVGSEMMVSPLSLRAELVR